MRYSVILTGVMTGRAVCFWNVTWNVRVVDGTRVSTDNGALRRPLIHLAEDRTDMVPVELEGGEGWLGCRAGGEPLPLPV